MKILAIETSCDETSAAVLTEHNGKPVLLSNIVSSQIDVHKKYGGVVPEVAARAHIENILPVIEEALATSETKLQDLDYIGVTIGPGLVGSLVVGIETAKALSLALGIPFIPLNHLEGHLYANFLTDEEPKFPLVALLVSGGHTLLVYMKNHLDYRIIGRTKDDAAGEAFDKGAKIIGLPYPGGPEISKRALLGDENSYIFPIIDLTPKPKRNKDGFLMYEKPSLDFSFSGLKTALLNEVKKKQKLTEKDINDLSASYQKAIIENLVQNCERAVKEYCPKTFILSGGVAANKALREALGEKLRIISPKIKYLIPPFELCTDNAGMIAGAIYYKIIRKKISSNSAGLRESAEPNLSLAD